MGLSISSVMPTIAVEDLDRAIRFYSDTLGLLGTALEGDMESALVEVGDSDRMLLYKSSYRRGETTVRLRFSARTWRAPCASCATRV